jgi:hypothetical protein
LKPQDCQKREEEGKGEEGREKKKGEERGMGRSSSISRARWCCYNPSTQEGKAGGL